MKRSYSSSNIPVSRKLSFRGRESSTSRLSTRRSESVSRLSTRDSIIAPKRNPSVERRTPKSGTPLNRVVSKHPSSGSSSKLFQTTPASSFQEKKTVQALATSKKWVAEQYAKVQDFIEHSGLFETTIVNRGNIKPPSIKVFVYTTKILLEQFFGDLKMEISNFKEIIIEKLKILQYPGGLRNSILKTVSTMHSWPQIIGMWAWLTDKIITDTREENDISLTQMDENDREIYLKREHCQETILKRYGLFNSGDNPKMVDQANEIFQKRMLEILKVDKEMYTNLETEIQENERTKKKQEKEMSELETHNQKIRSMISNLLEEIQEFEETCVRELNLTEQLDNLIEQKSKLVSKREAARAEIDQLRATIKVQPCTFKKKNELLSHKKQLNTDIEAKKEVIKFRQTIKKDYDEKIYEETKTISTIVTGWNCQIVPLSIKEPRLKALLFQETAFHRVEFLDEIKEVLRNQATIDGTVTREVELADKEVSGLQDQITEKEFLLMSLDAKILQLQEKSKDLIEKMQALKDEVKELIHQWKREQSELINEKENLQQSTEAKVLQHNLNVLQKQVASLDQELAKLMKKSVAFFMEIKQFASENLKQICAILDNVEDKMTKKCSNLLQNQSAVLAEIEHLKALFESN